ncbi:MAG: ABC transporter substrate-binding protein [Actinobacteria bacterium]|nr:ABC transporter substrate-binding protein [Actinomycetota bacterium]
MRAASALTALTLVFGAVSCNPSDGVPGPDSTVLGEEGDQGEDVVDPVASTPQPIFEPNEAVLNVAIAEPATLDPLRISDAGAVLIARQLFEGLTRWDPVLEKVKPAAAESWTASRDGTAFAFKLRPGMTFHDGSPVTSKHFALAFDRIALKSNASDLAYTLERVAGFDAMNRSGTASHLSGISTPDDLTLVIRLSEPYHDFPVVLTHPALVPVPRVASTDLDEFLTNPVGNGPFRMAQEWSPGSSVLLRAYEGFIQTPELDGIRFLAYPDAAGSWVDFVKGDLDVAEVPAGQVQDAERRFGADHFVPFLKSEYVGINVTSPALRNEKMRKAINFAIDRRRIANSVFKGTLQDPRGIIPAGLPGFQENLCVKLCDFAPDRAKALVREIPKKDRSVTFSYTQGPPINKLAQLVRRNLENVGLKVKAKRYQFPAYLRLLQSKEQETYRLGWFAEVPTPDVFLDPLFRSTSSDNHSGFASRKVDALLAQAHRAPNAGKRLALYIEAEKAILRSAPVVPIGSFVSRWAVQPDVQDIAFDVMGGFDATEVDLAND